MPLYCFLTRTKARSGPKITSAFHVAKNEIHSRAVSDLELIISQRKVPVSVTANAVVSKLQKYKTVAFWSIREKPEGAAWNKKTSDKEREK